MYEFKLQTTSLFFIPVCNYNNWMAHKSRLFDQHWVRRSRPQILLKVRISLSCEPLSCMSFASPPTRSLTLWPPNQKAIIIAKHTFAERVSPLPNPADAPTSRVLGICVGIPPARSISSFSTPVGWLDFVRDRGGLSHCDKGTFTSKQNRI